MPNQNARSAKIRMLAQRVRGLELSAEQVNQAAELLIALAHVHELLSDREFSSVTYDVLAHMFEAQGVALFTFDTALDIRGLQEKYVCEHPHFPKSDWRYEVANDDTHLGYWDWLENKIACFPDDVEGTEQ